MKDLNAFYKIRCQAVIHKGRYETCQKRSTYKCWVDTIGGKIECFLCKEHALLNKIDLD
jgi:hypothetical protein